MYIYIIVSCELYFAVNLSTSIVRTVYFNLEGPGNLDDKFRLVSLKSKRTTSLTVVVMSFPSYC